MLCDSVWEVILTVIRWNFVVETHSSAREEAWLIEKAPNVFYLKYCN